MLSKSVHVITMGCQMNVYDSERMLESLLHAGYQKASGIDSADIVIINSCSVREKPVDKLFSALGRARSVKKRNWRARLVIAGCVAKQLGKSVLTRAPYVDVVVGPDCVGDIVELLEERERRARPIVALTAEDASAFAPTTGEPYEKGRAAAFVTIMKGCNQHCSYCIVPLVRGPEFSKEPGRVLDECRRLLDCGVRDITLLGQNVNRYGLDGSSRDWPTFAELLRNVHDLDGLLRLSFVTSHPSGAGDELLACYRDLPKLVPYLHLPVQSGSNKILAVMNRRYTIESYVKFVDELKQIRPGIMLSTDFIVGHPGETDEDFEDTLRLARHVRYGMAYSFKYCPRPGTKSASMADDVPEAVKQERLERLQELHNQTMMEGMSAHVGKVEEVLLENRSRPLIDGVRLHQWIGRTDTRYVVNAAAAGTTCKVGDVVKIRILSAGAHSLRGEII